MLGAGDGQRSFVVGGAASSPTLVQQRGSSCADPAKPAGVGCSWASGFFPSLPNPRLGMIAGALVAGPGAEDALEARRAADGNRVSLADNAGFLGVLAGLQATGTNVRSCDTLNGLYAQVIAGRPTLA
jgi:hypothetical protein